MSMHESDFDENVFYFREQVGWMVIYNIIFNILIQLAIVFVTTVSDIITFGRSIYREVKDWKEKK